MPVATTLVTTAWTPPPTLTGVSATSVEEGSYIQLNWDISTLPDNEFVAYRIYRREVGDVLYTVLVDIPAKATVTYEDKTAGQRVNYEYVITQYKAITGDVPLESAFLTSAVVSISLESDAWFIVPNGLPALELTVIKDEHSSVIQQEVFEPLATNRKRVIRGNILGDEGSLTSHFDTMVARATKTYFESLNQLHGPHILKSPFGDVWQVEFDAPGYRYLTGGHLEVTFGWVEIS